MTQMYVTGVSQGNVAEVTAPVLGVTPSARTISRMTADLATRYET